MLLSQGESELRHEHVVPYRLGDVAGRASVYLTNDRLVVESSPGRILATGAPTTVLDVPLSELRNASVGSFLGRRRYLAVEAGREMVRLDVVDPGGWVRAVTEAKSMVPHPRSQRATATHTIERHVVKIRCRHCGGLSDELRTKCPNCGAAL